MQPFQATVPKDGKSWWLRLGREGLPEKFIFTLLMDMMPDCFLNEMSDVEVLSQMGEYTVYAGVFEGERLGVLFHGSGSFSVSTAIDEMAALGVKAILRVGNSGALSPDLRVGGHSGLLGRYSRRPGYAGLCSAGIPRDSQPESGGSRDSRLRGKRASGSRRG